MSTYLSEDEQVAQLKKLWKDYGWSTLIAVAVGLAISYGWHFWKNRQLEIRYQASNGYEHLLLAQEQNDTAQVQKITDNLKQHFSHTPYAGFAALIAAKQAVDDNHLDKALAQLTWVVQHAKLSATRQIARNRKARILLAQHKPQAALHQLKKIDDASFSSAVEVIKGDAYMALKQTTKAKHAYGEALTHYPSDLGSRLIVERQFHQLPAKEA